VWRLKQCGGRSSVGAEAVAGLQGTFVKVADLPMASQQVGM
jgi:hypothetical protein